jgi:hypothetical protein
MVVLSTGVARDEDERDYTAECDVFGGGRVSGPLGDAGVLTPVWLGGVAPPEGYPVDSTQCDGGVASAGTLAYDDVGLEIEVHTPSNATALAFDSMFLTYEYPDFVCSRFNDFFVVLMLDAAPSEYKDKNILRDANGDPVGVNSGLLSVCTPAEPGRVGRTIVCAPGSSSQLIDTGYGVDEATCAPVIDNQENIGGAATGWLHTEIPVPPLTDITLRFVLWDSGDPLLDSTVLVDNFRFVATPPESGTRPAPPITAR